MSWKKPQPKLGAVRADNFTNHSGLVKRGLIGKNNQGAGTSVPNLLKKLHIPFSIDILFFQRLPQFTRRGADRQHVITTPLIADRHCGGLAHGTPGAARPRPNPHAGLVLKPNIGPELHRQPMDFREFNRQKGGHFRLLLLHRPITGFLTAQVQLVQRQAHRGFRHPDPEMLFQ